MDLCHSLIPEEFKFEEEISEGSVGIDVRCLHLLLDADPGTRNNRKEEKKEGYFGPETSKALRMFQGRYDGLIKSSDLPSDPPGVVGEKTKLLLNAILAGGIPDPMYFEV